MVVRPLRPTYGRQNRRSGHTLRPISTQLTHDQRTWPIHNQHIVSYNQHTTTWSYLTTTPITTNLRPIFQRNYGHTLQPHRSQPTYDQYPRGNNNQWNVITANHTTNTLSSEQSHGQVATNLTTTFPNWIMYNQLQGHNINIKFTINSLQQYATGFTIHYLD